jgi:hypothetical protein
LPGVVRDGAGFCLHFHLRRVFLILILILILVHVLVLTVLRS